MSAPAADAARAMARGVEVLSPTAFRVDGRPFERPPATRAEEEAAEGGSLLLPLLQEALYGLHFVRAVAAEAAAPPAEADDDLLPALAAANPGRDRFEDGWEVAQALSTGRVVARRHGRSRLLWPGEFLSADGPGLPPRVGAPLRAWHPRDSAAVQPGFYHLFGEAAEPPGDGDAIVRLYWHAGPDAAPRLVTALAGALNRYGVPFRMKCLSRRSLHPRTDAAVLYVARRHARLSLELAAQAHAAVGPSLGEAVPPFTLRLARGLALAEDPGTGDSFGMDRCRRVAEGLWAAWRAGAADEDARVAAVEDAFRRGGLDPERPWLSPGSRMAYSLPA